MSLPVFSAGRSWSQTYPCVPDAPQRHSSRARRPLPLGRLCSPEYWIEGGLAQKRGKRKKSTARPNSATLAFQAMQNDPKLSARDADNLSLAGDHRATGLTRPGRRCFGCRLDGDKVQARDHIGPGQLLFFARTVSSFGSSPLGWAADPVGCLPCEFPFQVSHQRLVGTAPQDSAGVSGSITGPPVFPTLHAARLTYLGHSRCSAPRGRLRSPPGKG